MSTRESSEGEGIEVRVAYEAHMASIRTHFEATGDGLLACRTRAEAVDRVLRELWRRELGSDAGVSAKLCLVGLGGYGRRQLFPFSDVDILICAERTSIADRARDNIRRFSQGLWDCGLKVALSTRALGDLERFKSHDPEGSLAQLDLRFVAGSEQIFAQVHTKVVGKRSDRDARALATAAAELSRERHARFRDTLFHLEPNVKDAPGGLRDAHVCGWLAKLQPSLTAVAEDGPFQEAARFLITTRVFLHLRHGRDDNSLDWHAQGEAAHRSLGLGGPHQSSSAAPHQDAAAPHTPVPEAAVQGAANSEAGYPDAAYWMRSYFRHARAVERTLARSLERSGVQPKPSRAALRVKVLPRSGLFARDGVLDLKLPSPDLDPAGDPEIVLGAFGLMAESGIALAPAAEERIAAALPALSAGLEDGPRLWSRLRTVLTAPYAGKALREMHALGVLELILPEFHGIDALVIRDAYHRYTVDEHTFVLLDVLHSLAAEPPPGAPGWRLRFRSMLRELPYPELLYLAALLHDTGKGRATSQHAGVSAALATEVCSRLELGPFETGLVVRLIDCHLEMSAALRRDIFDTESVRGFAEKVGSQDLLRMLTLFTYADISAVHPDALTSWKAEDLWRLSMATANQLDRSVDEDRVHAEGAHTGRAAEGMLRALGRWVPDRNLLAHFLEGFPERYLRTCAPDAVRRHFLAATGGEEGRVLLSRQDSIHDLTVVGEDRPQLFAQLTSAFAAWGLDVVTAEAFSNAGGTVIDTFRFTDPYGTLELNPEERDRFTADLRSILAGNPAALPQGVPRRTRRKAPHRVIETRIEYDNTASSHSTLVQVIAQDTPGLLRTVAWALSGLDCSLEVALIDTEGEMAIDVLYIRRAGKKLTAAEAGTLCDHLLQAIAAHAG